MSVIIAPLRTEKIVKLAVNNRTLAFIVNLNATKKEIKEDIERIFKVKVDKINTHIKAGKKVAYVKFTQDTNVEELARQLNIA
jgi:large subunit ribosomal protein L23